MTTFRCLLMLDVVLLLGAAVRPRLEPMRGAVEDLFGDPCENRNAEKVRKLFGFLRKGTRCCCKEHFLTDEYCRTRL